MPPCTVSAEALGGRAVPVVPGAKGSRTERKTVATSDLWHLVRGEVAPLGVLSQGRRLRACSAKERGGCRISRRRQPGVPDNPVYLEERWAVSCIARAAVIRAELDGDTHRDAAAARSETSTRGLWFTCQSLSAHTGASAGTAIAGR